MTDLIIRKAESPADYLACQRAQRAAWGLDDESYIVPVATMVGAQHHGGLVLGAFRPDGEAVGLSFAFLGRTEGRLCLYSQLTGVVPELQAQGLGYQLKTAQREFARSEGIPCVAWAFDPLQAGNARFNLDKLGATAGRYVVDMYGPRTDALNCGTPTDRLIAVWETFETPRATVDPDEARAWPALLRGAERIPTYAGLPEGASRLTLEIPADLKTLRAEDPERAGRWGMAVRAAFLAAFDGGFRAIGFVRRDTQEGRRTDYVLDSASAPPDS